MRSTGCQNTDTVFDMQHSCGGRMSFFFLIIFCFVMSALPPADTCVCICFVVSGIRYKRGYLILVCSSCTVGSQLTHGAGVEAAFIGDSANISQEDTLR